MTFSILPAPGETVSFGPFRLHVAQRRLERDGAPVDVGSRALDLLIALVEQAGQPVRNRDLLAKIWRDTIVEESSLRAAVAGLRRVLGDGVDGARYIINIPAQGYCLVAPVDHGPASGPPEAAATRREPAYALPHRLPRMIGRDEQVQELAAQLQAHRFVSIVGPGGMGKTTVAVAVGHALLPQFDGEVCFCDLAVLSSADLLGSTVAATLGLKMAPGDPMPGLLTWLRDRKILLILDNCEHVIDGAAAFAEQLFHASPGVHLLSTSREILRAEGEHAYRLPPLPSPPVSMPVGAAQAMTFPAVQLFVERATANGNDFELDDADATIIGDICRKLDGIALAIELGASRVAAFGVRGTADLLDNRFRLTWQGRRTALPRHQTLNAMLDWSYNLLPEPERLVLRRLSTFVGPFSIDAACRIAAHTEDERVQVVDVIESLVAKSLASTEPGRSALRYRLLESARVYAAEKLKLSGEADDTARRHAAYLTGYLGARQDAFLAFPAADAAAPNIDMLGNVRACLAWCFSPGGDERMGVALCAAAAPLLLELSLLAECQHWTRRALAHVNNGGECPFEEMALQEAFAIASMFTTGNSDAVLAAIQRGLELACALGNRAYELRLLAGMNIFLTRVGDLDGALDIAERSTAVATALDHPAADAMAAWMLGVAYHLIGDQRRARHHCEEGLGLVAGLPHLNTLCFGYDHRVRAQVALARALWLGGSADRAVQVAWEAIAEGERLGHPISYCIALIYAAPVFIWTGNWTVARELVDRLALHAEDHLLAPYQAVAKGLKGELLVKNGAPAQGIELLQECTQVLRANHHRVLASAHLAAVAEGFCALGRHAEALSSIEAAVALGPRVFNAPEILRIQGAVLASMPGADLGMAETCLWRSLECARQQHAGSWELRTATTLCALLKQRGRGHDGHALLRQVLGQRHEGLGTADYQAAKRLLDSFATS